MSLFAELRSFITIFLLVWANLVNKKDWWYWFHQWLLSVKLTFQLNRIFWSLYYLTLYLSGSCSTIEFQIWHVSYVMLEFLEKLPCKGWSLRKRKLASLLNIFLVMIHEEVKWCTKSRKKFTYMLNLSCNVSERIICSHSCSLWVLLSFFGYVCHVLV